MVGKTLRILRTITWLPVGGIEQRIVALLPQLKERGHYVEVVCLREFGPLVEELRSGGIPVKLIKLKSRLHPQGLWQLAKFTRAGNFDIVHSHMYRSNVPTTMACRLARFPGVVLSQIHNISTWESWRQLLLDRFLCRWRNGVVAVSEAVRRDIIQNLRIPAEKCFVIYNGVEIEKFRQAVPEPTLRDALGIAPEDVVLITVARLVEQKNHRLIIEAAPEILKAVPQAKFLFVGEGKLRPYLERLVKNRGLANYFIFAGKRTDVPQLLKISTIALLPSLKEGFSNTILEAMAGGLPVIASNVGGNPEAVLDGKTGYIISPHEAESLAQAVVRLARDPHLRQQMAENALQHLQKFSLHQMLTATESLYYELLSSK